MILRQKHFYKLLICTNWCVLVGTILFSAFYLFHSYAFLNNWFKELTPCFYKQQTWSVNFFTKSVKEVGNQYCLLAIFLSVLPILFERTQRNRRLSQDVHLSSFINDNRRFLSVLILISICIACYFIINTKPWYDEVFSTDVILSMHPFQVIGYYMLPNNHLFFNFINRLLFSWMGDYLLSGRLLSMISYIGIVCAVYFILLKLVKNKPISFLGALLVCFHAPILGFASQARGYELQLFFAMISVIGYYQFHFNDNKQWLWIANFGMVCGYFTIPTFLFFHAALLLFFAGIQINSRKFDIYFWAQQCIILIVVYLLYLPAICFSGLNAIIGNEYVKPEAATKTDYLPLFKTMMQRGLVYCFAFKNAKIEWLNYGLLFFPVLLVFVNDKFNRAVGFFYVLIWVVFVLLNIKMRSTLPSRGMMIQFGFSMLCIIYTICIYSILISRRIRALNNKPHLLSSIFLVVLLLHFSLTDAHYIRHLYGKDVNEVYSKNRNALISHIAKEKNISFSEESFYWKYIAQKESYRMVSLCDNAVAFYYVKRNFEQLPAAYIQYRLLYQADEEYQIFQKP